MLCARYSLHIQSCKYVESEKQKTIFHTNCSQEVRDGYTNITQNRILVKSVTRDKGCFILLKRSVYQEYITNVNICKPNKQCSKPYEAKFDRTIVRKKTTASCNQRVQ